MPELVDRVPRKKKYIKEKQRSLLMSTTHGVPPSHGDPATDVPISIFSRINPKIGPKNDKNCGPKPLSLLEYQARNNKPIQPTQKPKRKSRGGKAVKNRRTIANLYRISNITTNKKQKNLFLDKIKNLKKKKSLQKRIDDKFNKIFDNMQQFINIKTN